MSMDQGVRFVNCIQDEKIFSTARLVPTQQIEGTGPPLLPTRTNLIMVNGRLQKIPRPQNAFMLYANDNRKLFLGRFPNECNSKISTKLGEAWSTLPTAEKDSYYKKAQAADLEHKKKYPFYHYTPAMSKVQKRRYQTNRRMVKEQARRHQVSQAIEHQRETLQSLVQSINGVIHASKLAGLKLNNNVDARKDKDDMQVLTPVRAQQMVSKVQLGMTGLPLQNSSPQIRPRRGRPPKVRSIPVVSDPVPAAPRRGRPRKHPAVVAPRSQRPPKVQSAPMLPQTGRQLSRSSSTGSVISSSAVNNTSSSVQHSDRGSDYTLSQPGASNTSETRYSPVNTSKPIYPDSFVFKTQTGGTMGMKLIPISGTKSQNPNGNQSSTSIPNTVGNNSGTNIDHGPSTTGPGGPMMAALSGTPMHTVICSKDGTTRCVQTGTVIQGASSIHSGTINTVSAIRSKTNIPAESRTQSCDDIRSQVSNQNETSFHHETWSDLRTHSKRENVCCRSHSQGRIIDNAHKQCTMSSILSKPITIEPCDDDSMMQNRHDMAIRPQSPSPQQCQILEEPFSTLPHYVKESIQTTNQAPRNEMSGDAPSPMLVDSKESIIILEDGMDSSSNHTGDSMDALYPCKPFTSDGHMSSGIHVHADYLQSIDPPPNPMDRYKPGVVAPNPCQYQAGDYQAGWGEPYSRLAGPPYGAYQQFSTIPQYPRPYSEQCAVTPHQMHYPEHYAAINTSATVCHNDPNMYHSSGDGMAPRVSYDTRVKDEVESGSTGPVRPVVNAQIERESHRSTADHISDALRTLTD